MTEEEYRKVNAISYSELSGVDKTPANLIIEKKLDTDGIKFGSAVDTLLFDGEEKFNEKFIAMGSEVPTQIIKDIIDELYRITSGKNSLSDEKDLILSIANDLKFGAGNWKDETKINKVITSGEDYYNLLCRAEGKTILDGFMYDQVRNTCNTLVTHPFSADKINARDDDTEVIYQFPIFWKYLDYDCKSLLDILYIDHKSKTIYPRDLKTSFTHILGFIQTNYLKFRYYLQESFYTDAVIYWKNNIQTELKDYKVAPFEFIIISSQDYSRPLIYKGNQDSYELGKFGGIVDGRYRKGYKQLIEERAWYIKNEKYSYPYEIYQSNGVVDIKL